MKAETDDNLNNCIWSLLVGKQAYHYFFFSFFMSFLQARINKAVYGIENVYLYIRYLFLY